MRRQSIFRDACISSWSIVYFSFFFFFHLVRICLYIFCVRSPPLFLPVRLYRVRKVRRASRRKEDGSMYVCMYVSTYSYVSETPVQPALVLPGGQLTYRLLIRGLIDVTHVHAGLNKESITFLQTYNYYSREEEEEEEDLKNQIPTVEVGSIPTGIRRKRAKYLAGLLF